MNFVNPEGLPPGKLCCWILSENHKENTFHGEDLGYLELTNGFIIDLGYYRNNYCVKVSLNCEDRDGPRWVEMDLTSQYLEFTSNRPLIALTQFIEIANHFNELKIRNTL